MFTASVPVVAAIAVLVLMASQASAASVSGVSFSGSSQVAGATSTYTVGFTNCPRVPAASAVAPRSP